MGAFDNQLTLGGRERQAHNRCGAECVRKQYPQSLLQLARVHALQLTPVARRSQAFEASLLSSVAEQLGVAPFDEPKNHRSED